MPRNKKAQTEQLKSREVRFEKMQIDALVPYAKNARVHSPEQVNKIAQSIERFGFIAPVIIDAEGGIIAGHGRIMAARQLGLQSVPVVRVEHLSESEKRAYILADNKLALESEWDERLLAEELSLIANDGLVPFTGFEPYEYEVYLNDYFFSDNNTSAKPDLDSVPEVQKEIVTCKGDIWILGRHRLMCGDSTKTLEV